MKYQTQINEPLISIIVPVFQVEKYLEKCIFSIITQTYQNLEIILIDDGSTDNCPIICDKFQTEDTRIKVIHKENGGLSQARNIGLKLAKGDFIGFVDSDDWIAPNMFKILMFALQKTGADIAVCNFQYESENIITTPIEDESIELMQYSSEETLKKIITVDGDIKSFVWNKLYKKDVISNIEFPDGKIYEDTIWTVKVIGNAKRIVFINYPFYHYRYRSESLSHNNQQLAKRTHDLIEMNELRIEYIHEYYPALIKTAITNFQNLCCLEYINISTTNSQFDLDNIFCKKLHKHFCQFGVKSIFVFENFKMAFARMLFYFSPWLLMKSYMLYKHIFCKYHFRYIKI